MPALTRSRQELLLRFAQGLCQREDITVRAGSMLLVDRLHRLDPGSRRPLRILQRIDCRGSASLELLRCRIMEGGAGSPCRSR
ncbi:MAG: hypothetical protein ACLTYD_02420 [Oscillospiraceae bacterium]